MERPVDRLLLMPPEIGARLIQCRAQTSLAGPRPVMRGPQGIRAVQCVARRREDRLMAGQRTMADDRIGRHQVEQPGVVAARLRKHHSSLPPWRKRPVYDYALMTEPLMPPARGVTRRAAARASPAS
ncbi:hypothetical protein GCM10010169_22460 [Micromonospora fulviviridis]|nr:hypothetical protein GCM10010169_22460 [Micromonospora fulviviridis]